MDFEFFDAFDLDADGRRPSREIILLSMSDAVPIEGFGLQNQGNIKRKTATNFIF